MTRSWPGNVRELIQETRRAAHEALASGSREVRVEHLSPNAGRGFDVRDDPLATSTPTGPGASSATPPTKEAIGAIFAAHGGNIAATARALGLHRAQVYRLLRRFGLVTEK